MKKNLLLITVLLMHYCTFAQSEAKVKVTWGGEYFLPKKHSDLGFIGNEKDGYVQIGHLYGKSLSLQRFDNKFNIKSEKIVNLKELPKGYMNEGFQEINNRYYWFFSTWDKKAEMEHLFVQEIDVNKGDFVKGAREILSAKRLSGTVIATGFYQFNTSNKWNITKSTDGKSKLLIQYRLKPTEKRDKINKDVIGLFVFDSNMNKEWGSEHQMPYTEEQMDNNDYYVDKLGNVLLVAKVKELEKSKDKKHPNFHFEILKWSKEDTKTQIIPFKFDDKFGTEVVIAEDNTGAPLVVGYYSKVRASGSADGFFVLKVNVAENKVDKVFKGMYEFPAEVLKQFESARAQRKIEKKDAKDESEIGGLRFRNLTIFEDGSLQLTGEQYIVTVTVYMTKYGPQIKYNHFYEDVYVAKVGADGELKFVTKVPKAQRAMSTAFSYWVGGMSIKSYFFKGKEYLLFLDNFKNLNISASTAPAYHADGLGGVLMLVGIDENGKTAKSKLFDFREEKRQLTVTNFSSVGTNQVMARTIGKKRVSKPFILTFE
ncbi:MAG: hypothetical protein JNL95_07120 [Chitinophagales bacterium]|nr:hypothetical protein [Chitinophagales bacterium]